MSPAAKCIMGGHFALGLTQVGFKRGVASLAPVARAAFDELVASGLLECRVINRAGSCEYRPTDAGKLWLQANKVSMAFIKEHGRFPMTTPP